VNKKGVSPIIGTLLIVLIAVVISAFVMAMSFGMAEKSRQTYIVTFQLVDQKVDEFTILFYGGADFQYLRGVKIIIDGVVYVEYNSTPNVGTQWYFKDGQTPTGPGAQSVTVSLSPGKNDDHLIVVGKFLEDIEVVVLDTYV
jgi:flagellin-like protein